jgi:hypothetical protein
MFLVLVFMFSWREVLFMRLFCILLFIEGIYLGYIFVLVSIYEDIVLVVFVLAISLFLSIC